MKKLYLSVSTDKPRKNFITHRDIQAFDRLVRSLGIDDYRKLVGILTAWMAIKCDKLTGSTEFLSRYFIAAGEVLHEKGGK